MKVDKLNKYIEIVRQIVLNNIPRDAEIFLFGSAVTGHFTRSSDY